MFAITIYHYNLQFTSELQKSTSNCHKFQTQSTTNMTSESSMPCTSLPSINEIPSELTRMLSWSPSSADYIYGIFCFQLGPQQLKYMTFLRDSSDCFIFSSLNLLETIAEVEEERFLVWEIDLRLFFACCCADLMMKFHLQIPWSFMASTTPTLAATIALPVELIFYPCKTLLFS